LDQIVAVTTANENRRLVSLVRLKRELGITDRTSDDLLNDLRDDVSRQIARHCAREFARDALTITIRLDYPGKLVEAIALKGPFPQPDKAVADYVTLTSVTENDTALDVTADVEIDPESGLLYRLCAGARIYWPQGAKIVVVLTAGYVLPDDRGTTTLPSDVQRAALDLAKMAHYARRRDPLLRSSSIEGMSSQSFALPGAVGGMDGAIPGNVAGMLSAFKRFDR
jgi:hypothetical protein